MHFRLLETGNAIPYSFACDPSASFQPGQAAQLTVVGNTVMATVSDGLSPVGIIDDLRTNAFTSTAWNESFIVPCDSIGTGPNNEAITLRDLTYPLDNSNILKNTFFSIVSCQLKEVNGVVIFPAGTPLNHSITGTTYDSIKNVVNYTYYIPNMPGDDSTASGRITVWFQRMMVETDQFETNQQYLVNANLYISRSGKFTTAKASPYHPPVGMVIGPPSPFNANLQLLWY